MKYCQGCGTKIEEGDVFCTNCGRKQVEVSSAFTTLKNQVNEVKFSDSKDILLKMVLRPVTGAKEFIEKGEKRSVIAITLFLTIMQGLLGIWKVNQFFSSLEKVAVDFLQKVASFANLARLGSMENAVGSNEIMDVRNQINQVKYYIEIPYGKMFLQNSALFIISVAILFIILYLGTNIISKNKIETFTIYKTALIVLVPTLNFELFSIICSYLSFSLGFCVAVIGVMISIGCLAIVIKENLHIDENHSVFIVAISFIVIFIGDLMILQNFTASNISDLILSVTNNMKNFRF